MYINMYMYTYKYMHTASNYYTEHHVCTYFWCHVGRSPTLSAELSLTTHVAEHGRQTKV